MSLGRQVEEPLGNLRATFGKLQAIILPKYAAEAPKYTCTAPGGETFEEPWANFRETGGHNFAKVCLQGARLRNLEEASETFGKLEAIILPKHASGAPG